MRDAASLPVGAKVFLSFHSERSAERAAQAAAEARVRGHEVFAGGVSRAIVETLSAHFVGVAYLPDGVFATEWRPRVRPAPGPLRVGLVGLLDDAKGLGLFRELAAEQEIEPVTHWREREGAPRAGALPDDLLLPEGCVGPLFHRMDAYAMWSEREGTPLPLLEAMASGVCPVATRAGAAPELIEHGRNGFLVERTADSIRACLRRNPPLDRALAFELGTAARESVLRIRPGLGTVGAYRRWYRRGLGHAVHPLDVDLPLRVVVVIAHPDDETLWIGGTRRLLPHHHWTVICATHDANSARGRELAALAAKEGFGLVMLGLEDRAASSTAEGADPGLERAVHAALRDLAPMHEAEVVLTHNARGEYGHAHHVAVHRAVGRWRAERAPGAACFVFGDGDGPVRLRLPPPIAAAKAAALESYRSELRQVRLLAHAARWRDEETLLPWD